MTILRSLVRNGAVIRAVLLAVTSVAVIVAGHPVLVPFAVAGYTVWNAVVLTATTARKIAADAHTAR